MPERSKKRLSRQLLKLVFGCYFIVAMSVTIGQLLLEYRNGRAALVTELEQLHAMTQKSLSFAVWEYNEDQFNILLNGFLKMESVKGVKLYDSKDSEIAEAGDSQLGERGFAVEKTIQFEDDLTGKIEPVGKVAYLSSENIVLNKVKYSFLLILANSLVKTFALWMIFLLAVRALVERPLGELEKVSNDYDPASSDSSASVPSLQKLGEREDELGSLSRSFSRMVGTIGDYVTKLSDFNKSLEDKVAARTAEIKEKNRNINAILNTMELGVCTIKGDGHIHSQYSPHLRKVLGSEDPGEYTIQQLLLQPSDLSADRINQVVSIIHTSVGDDSLSFNMNRNLLPNEITIKNGEQLKILMVDWQTIIDDHDKIESILVVINDITEQRRSQKAKEISLEDLRITDQILQKNVNETEYFLDSTHGFIKSLRRMILRSGRQNHKDLVNQVFILLHTIKGNARFLNFSLLVEAAHEAEEYFVQVREGLGDWDVTYAYEKLESITVLVERYEYVLKERIIGFSSKSTSSNTVVQIKNYIADHHRSPPEQVLEYIREMVTDDRNDDFESVLSEIINNSAEVCRHYDKPAPHFDIKGNFRLESKFLGLMREIMSHCVKNSISHGFESLDERLIREKPAQPKVSIHASIAENHLELKYFDDGRGLNMSRLRELGKHKGLLKENSTAEEIAEIIYYSGVSTVDDVTDIAGRGVGMDAIRSFVEQADGSVSIQLEGDTNQDFVAFALCFTLPLRVLQHDQSA